MQLKDFVSITASLINKMRSSQSKVTDFNVGSVARTMLEAPAAEIEELYQQMFIGLRESIPVAVYNAFEFSRLPAQKATGTIRYTVTSSPQARSISAGAAFSRSGSSVKFAAVRDVTIPAGASFVDVPVAAVTPGLIPPVPAGAAFTPESPVDGTVSAVSVVAFYQGADEETPEQQKLRFMAYIQSIHRGTVSSIQYAIDTFGVVVDASGAVIESCKHRLVDEPWRTNPAQPPGLINIYIHNGVSGASSALVTKVQQVVDGYYDASGKPVPGYKSAGAKAVVAAATSQSVGVTGSLTIDSTFLSAEVVANVLGAVSAYIFSLPIGGAVLRAEIIAAIMSVPGVVNVSLTSPSADVSVSFSAKAIPGTVAVS